MCCTSKVLKLILLPLPCTIQLLINKCTSCAVCYTYKLPLLCKVCCAQKLLKHYCPCHAKCVEIYSCSKITALTSQSLLHYEKCATLQRCLKITALSMQSAALQSCLTFIALTTQCAIFSCFLNKYSGCVL